MGRNCYGPKLTGAELVMGQFVMGRNDPEPSRRKETVRMRVQAMCLHTNEQYEVSEHL